VGSEMCVSDSLGVPPSSSEAARRIGIAARAGLGVAELDYAMMAFNGRGLQRDEAIAAQWFRSSAEKGNVVAQNRLARLLSAGRGVERDDVAAVGWHILARKGGVGDARLDLLIETLSPDQRKRARTFADEFVPRKEVIRSIRTAPAPKG